MCRLICFFLLALSPLAHGQTDVDLKLKPGAYGVGVRVIRHYDDARVYQGRMAPGGSPAEGKGKRPLQILAWYPTRDNTATITHADYLRISRSEEDFKLAPEEITRRVDAWVSARSARLPKETVQQALRQRTSAHMDAAPAPGKYPVVIYAPGFGSSAHENSDLCEYLASQGYVVMASASIGSRSRAMTQDLDGIEAQAADIRFLIGSAQGLAQADLAHVGVIGFSWGGISNVVAAARDDRIRALVSLEGAFRYEPQFVDGSAGAAKEVSPARVALPLLYVAARPKSIEQLNVDKTDTRYSFMNGMTSTDVYLATMRPLQHLDFASQLLRFSPPDPADEYTREEVLTAYAWTARYVHQFLDAYLKGSAEARTFLQKQAIDNGTPPHMMSIEKRLPTTAPPK